MKIYSKVNSHGRTVYKPDNVESWFLNLDTAKESWIRKNFDVEQIPTKESYFIETIVKNLELASIIVDCLKKCDVVRVESNAKDGLFDI